MTDSMNSSEAGYALSKQLPSIEFISTNYGDLFLDYEMKKAVQKALTPILESNLPGKSNKMKILTPLQSVLNNIETKITPEEILALKKEIINSYAAGFCDGHLKPSSHKIQDAVERSTIYHDIKNSELVNWFNEQKESAA